MRSQSFLPTAARAALALSLAFAGSTAALAADGAAAEAAAADPSLAADSSEGSGLETIVVTAQKRPENLQNTPISISVLSSNDMVNRHVTSLLDLGDGAIPSLKIAPFYARNSALIVNIRGIGVLSDSNQPARDQGVGVYIDGVYLGRAQGLGTALFDIQSLEVLKGPQGTLFGRNTEGGAVNITTKKPSGEFHLNATAGIGNFGAHKGEVHLDLPSFQNISVKLDGVVSHRDAMVANPLQGSRGFNSYDKRGLHVEALWKPAPNFSADYSFDISHDDSTSLYLQLIGLGTNKQAAVATLQTTRASVANVGVPELPSIGDVHGHRLSLDWELAPKLTLKSISSYRELTQSQFDNGSAASGMSNNTGVFTNVLFARNSLAQFRQNQASQEFQIVGELPRVNFVAGALWYQERVQDNAQAVNTNKFTDAAGSTYTVLPIDYTTVSIDRASHVTTTSIGAFGQATWTPDLLDDAIHVTGGLRWTRDMKHGQLFTVNNALPVVFGVSGVRNLDAAWSRVDPMINIAIDATRDVHLYGKWSTGYKSGGANSRSLQYRSFDPETVSVFEVGAKTEFWNHRARFNIAAYAGTYKNIQVDFLGLFETVVNGVTVRSTRTTLETLNAPGTGGIHGVEAELTLNPVEGLTLGASYAHTYVRIPSAVNPFPNASGVYNTNPVPIYQTYTPSDSASGSLDYELPGQGFTFRAHLDANYDSGFYVNATDPVFIAPGNAGNVKQPKGDKAFIVNARLGIADIAVGNSDAKVAVSVWARNLFNEQHMFYKSLSVTSGLQGFFNEARTYGVELNVKM